MSSFLAQWIRNNMEDPVERERSEIERVQKVYNRSLILKQKWQDPTFQPDAHKSEVATMRYKASQMFSGTSGRDSRFLANPNSRAGSYESYIEIAEQQLAQAKKE